MLYIASNNFAPRAPVAITDVVIKELRLTSGPAFGFAMQGQQAPCSALILGEGAYVRAAFQSVLLWPARLALRGRLALVMADKIPSESSSAAMALIGDAIGQAPKRLVIPDMTLAGDRAAQMTLERIEAFCCDLGIVEPTSERGAA